MVVAQTPWASIPWQHKSLWQKIYSTFFITSIVYFVIYTSIYAISLYQYNKVQTDSQTHAIAILIDTSLSMSAADIKPNRYQHAISIAQGLISSFPASYITVPFGSIPLMRTPRSTDTIGIRSIIGQYSLGSYHVNDAYMGSAPGNALGYAWNALRKYPTEKKTIILLGDGSTNTGYSIDSFLPYLQKDDIQLYICVIGDSGYTLGQNYADEPVITTLDTSRLDSITQATHGAWRTCNARQSAINHLHQALDKSSHHEGVISQLPMNILYIIAVICVLYHILMISITIGIYVFGTKEKISTSNIPHT